MNPKKCAMRLISLNMCFLLFSAAACSKRGTTPDQGGVSAFNAAVWTASGAEKILRNTDYSARHEEKNFQITAFKNEYESAQIIITPSAATKYTVELSDLVEKDGVTKLPESSFSVYHEKYITVKSIFDGHALTGAGDYPDALVPYDKITACGENEIAGGANQGIWITLHADKEQKAGTYTGEFTVTVENSACKVPVSVTILDYVLSDETHIKNQFGMNWYEVAYGELDSSVEMQEAYYEFFINYRCMPEIFPGNEHGIYVTGEPVEEFISYAEKYAEDPRVSTYDIPHSFLQSSFKVPALNKESELIYDGEGNVVCEYRNIITNNMPLLKATLEAMLDCSLEKKIDLFRKAGHYAFFYDEYALMRDGDYRVNVNMLLMYRLFQQIAYTCVIEESKKNGEYDKLPAEEKVLIDRISERFAQATYIDQATNPESLKDAEFYEAYNKRYNGALDAFYDMMLARETGDKETVARAFDILSGEERAAIEKLIGKLTEFEKTLVSSIENIQARATGPKLDTIVAKTNFISTIDDFDSESARKELNDWSEYWFGDRAENWCYTCVNPKPPYPSYHLEDELLSARLLSWMMYEYNITGNLLWDSALYNIPGTTLPIQDYYQYPNRFPTANGDGFVVYPGREYGVFGPVASMRLEAIRDGSEEYELFYAVEEIYKARAAEKALAYDGTTLENVMSLMTKGMYNGTICRYYDGYKDNFAKNRDILNALVMSAANTGLAIERLEFDKGSVKVALSAPAATTISINGKSIAGTSANGIVTYATEIGLTENDNRLRVTASSGGKEYTLDLPLGGKFAEYPLAGENGLLSAKDIVTENVTATADVQDGENVWKLTVEKAETSRADFNVSALNVTQNVSALSLDLYAEKEISFVLFVRVKNGSYTRIANIDLAAGWNTVRLDATQFGMTDGRDLEKIRFKFENTFGVVKVGTATIEEKVS